MLAIFNIKDKKEYFREVAELTQKEWGSKSISVEEFNNKINKKIDKMILNLNNKYYCTLILLEKEKLIGFISIFEFDGDERKDLSPWYATMFVKKEYRGKGYSKVLNNAILEEAKDRGFNKIYLKTNLENYYEKFGAKYIEKLNNGEKLYYYEL